MNTFPSVWKLSRGWSKQVYGFIFIRRKFCESKVSTTTETTAPTLELSTTESKTFSIVEFLRDPSIQELLKPYCTDTLSDTQIDEQVREWWSNELDADAKKIASSSVRVTLFRKLQETTGIALPSNRYHEFRDKRVLDALLWYNNVYQDQLFHNSIVEEYIRKTFPPNVRLDPVSYRKVEKRVTQE
eukprot:jgi/Galph1/2035/GphlegSOOS_G715.1